MSSSLSFDLLPVPSALARSSGSSHGGKKKSVVFDDHLRVILIPSVVDYRAASLIQSMWWSSSDYKAFEEAAFSELKLFAINAGIGLKAARSMLYQPLSQAANHCVKAYYESFYSCESSSDSYDSSDSLDECSYPFLSEEELSESRKLIMSKFDDAMLSLCVPLRELLPMTFPNRRSRRSSRSSATDCMYWLGDLSVGFVSAVLFVLVLLPSVTNCLPSPV